MRLYTFEELCRFWCFHNGARATTSPRISKENEGMEMKNSRRIKFYLLTSQAHSWQYFILGSSREHSLDLLHLLVKSCNYLRAEIVRKKGRNLVNDPVSNKGLAFPLSERDRLNIRGLVPPAVLDINDQCKIIFEEYKTGWAARAEQEPEDEIIKSGVNPDNIRKWKVLQSVQDRNETLFYKLILENFSEMSQIIYNTPTVGWACSHFSHLYRRPRGIRILGLGDLGIGGLSISVGKLDLYVAAGGFHPRRVLPVVLDVGTNNDKLINDPRYLGIKRARLEGEQYYELMDELMAALRLRWPKALIQHEDFRSSYAVNLLKRYRSDYLMFNDDIQGTAATVLAGLYGALKVQGKSPNDLKHQTFVICGAGSAASGVLLTIRNAITKRYRLSNDEVGNQKWRNFFYDLSTFAANEIEMEGFGLLEVVKRVKPTVLIGLSACGGIFTDKVLKMMSDNCKDSLPIIFPLSNPTSRSECTAEQAQKYTQGRAIFASGSPFSDIKYGKNVIASSQCNNRYIFPGLALGAALGQTSVITNAMINKSAEALTELIENEDLERRATFPELVDIHEIAVHLATRVFEQAMDENLPIGNKIALEARIKGGEDGLKDYIRSKMWRPEYRPLVYLPPGKGE
ncbi:E1.1.1.39 [Lepeophtheirus salmonis]|uniref:E1.1.1.39 n=1 Tax=Lepeophtheirus salmonis TaxID=72036 RepID=A0A7R8CGH0_LEPSM|nr:E1.1.1.39 [Lepeophtheirus salmonis]CAF2816268.1 E1.1.1.39 [Lepeophtheirus salmonis]